MSSHQFVLFLDQTGTCANFFEVTSKGLLRFTILFSNYYTSKHNNMQKKNIKLSYFIKTINNLVQTNSFTQGTIMFCS